VRVSTPSARTLAWGALLVSVSVLAGCGSRGNPLPPVYPNPPAVTGLTVGQRGSFAILRFPPPALRVTVGSEDVELEDVEVLVYAERYPVLTAEMLIAAVARRGEVMRVDAAAERTAAANRAAAEAVAEERAAAGLPPLPPDPDAPATVARRRSPDENLIYRVPPEIREAWRTEGLAADAVLAAAASVVNGVDAVWRELGLPTTVIDTSEALLLPDAGAIAAASEALVEQATYERPLTVNAFLGRASVSRRVPIEQFEELLVDESLQVAIPVGTPSAAALRTRYFFAVRGSSTQNTPGLVTVVVPLAPAAVPVAPANLSVQVGADGVELSWTPPGGDVALRRLDPTATTYNVYRMLPDGIAEPAPLNPAPLTEPTYTDRTMQWGESYVYEVRALLAGPDGPAPVATRRRESEGAKTGAFQAVDIYPPAPPSDVNPTRAGSRVTLQWTPSATLDITGYRVYRHAFPAPAVPLRFDPTAEETDPAANAPRAAQAADEDNELVTAGWVLLTADAVPFSRYTDTDADPSVRYVYAVEAIDASGNLSALALGDTEPGDNER